jgi:hypothetical protein
MDADSPVSPRLRRSLGRLKVPVLKSLAIASVFLLVPPIAWLAGDLWRLAWVAEEGRNREEASELLLHSVIDSANQVAQWRFLHRRWGPDVPESARPVVIHVAPPPRPDEVIPRCPPAWEGAGYWPANWPRLAVDRAEFSLTRARLGSAGIVALDVCLNATPFAGRCERRLRRAQKFTVDEIGAEAVRLGLARVNRGRTCWCSAFRCADEASERQIIRRY